MRLFSWLRREVRPDTKKTYKDFRIGSSCTCFSAPSSRDDHFTETNANVVEASYESEVFHGFLTIGTFGSEPLVSEPPTPTLFPTTFNNEKAEVIEYDQEAEADDENGNESLARTSYVSIATICPLQGYLLGSGNHETRIDTQKEEILCERIFSEPKFSDEVTTKDELKGEEEARRAHKSPKSILKRIIKKFPSSPGRQAHHPGKKKKANEVPEMFNRKVYPVNSTVGEDFNQERKVKKTANLKHPDFDDDKEVRLSSKSVEGADYYNNILNLSQLGLHNNSSHGNRERWIKTDADYLVLEL